MKLDWIVLKNKLINMTKQLFFWCRQHYYITGVLVIGLILVYEKGLPIIMGKFFGRAPTVYVETVVVLQRPMVERWQAVGIVKAAQDIMLSSEVTGTIEHLAVTSGQAVKQGDVLISIRHDDISAALQKDQAQLAQKELYFQRLEKLVKTHMVTDEAFSVARSEYQQAQSQVTADQALLSKYEIKAPFAGNVGIWQVSAGQFVKPGDTLVSLTQMSPVYIDFMLPTNALNQIAIGDDVHFVTTSYPNRTWYPKVTAIDPQLDAATRRLSVRAEIDNDDKKLASGLYGQVTVVKQKVPQILIPQEAIIYDPKERRYTLSKKNNAQLQTVQLGEHIGDEVVIESGLNAKDEVVTAGIMKLFPNTPVIVNKKVVQVANPADIHVGESHAIH